MTQPEIIEAEILDDSNHPEPETGSLPSRFGALCFDLFLLVAVFGFIATQLVLPKWYPGAIAEFMEMVEQYEEGTQGQDPTAVSPLLMDAAQTINTLFLLLVFFYFALVPLFFGGGSLGMRIFNLRIQDRETNLPAPLRAHLVRGSVKTICLLIFFPLLTLLFLLALRTPQRIAPHDKLARTRVVRAPAFSAK